MSRSTIHQCPACEYSLLGLPPDHRCPECGFAYTSEMVVFSQLRRTALFMVILTGLCFFGVLLSAVTGRGFQLMEGVQVVMFALIFFGAYKALTGRPNRAVLSDIGIIIVESGERPLEIRWRDLRSIKQSALTNALTFYSKNSEPLGSMHGNFFGSKRKMDKFLTVAYEWHCDYQQRARRSAGD